MFNKVILIGRLVADPQIRHTQTGRSVTNFRLAVDRPGSGRSGEGQERQTDFIDIVTWDRLADTCSNYLRKGRLVAVDGRLQIREYDGQDGVRRKVAEVVANDVRFLDRGGQRPESQYAAGEGENEFGEPAGASGSLPNYGSLSNFNEGSPRQGDGSPPSFNTGPLPGREGTGVPRYPRYSYGTSGETEGRRGSEAGQEAAASGEEPGKAHPDGDEPGKLDGPVDDVPF